MLVPEPDRAARRHTGSVTDVDRESRATIALRRAGAPAVPHIARRSMPAAESVAYAGSGTRRNPGRSSRTFNAMAVTSARRLVRGGAHAFGDSARVCRATSDFSATAISACLRPRRTARCVRNRIRRPPPTRLRQSCPALARELFARIALDLVGPRREPTERRCNAGNAATSARIPG